MKLRKIGESLVAPTLAIAFSLVLTSLILAAFGASVIDVLNSMVGYGAKPRSLTQIINTATVYYLSAVAVAIGVKMNLFNIGTNGQYRLAAMAAGAVAGAMTFPNYIAIPITILVAVTVGALWAGIAAWLKVYRGVNEVISTIMLNMIATGVISYVVVQTNVGTELKDNIRGTALIPESGRMPGFNLLTDKLAVYGFSVVAILVGVLYWFMLNRTRFGFDLRATGLSATAAAASGVNSKRMVIYTMLLSGGIAGLIGLPGLLGKEYTYTLQFPANYGFTGIAIALLGRNHPVGIAFGSLLWAFLDVTSQILDLEGIPREIIIILQGVIVLAVVIAYEVVRRNRVKAQQKNVGKALAAEVAA